MPFADDSGFHKRKFGLNYAANNLQRIENKDFVLCKIIDATLVMSPDPDELDSKYVWRYRVAPAKWTWTGLGAIPSSAFLDVTPPADPIPAYYAFSISELGNTLNYYSYGHDPADFPAGIQPKRIPDDTPVLCWCQPNAQTGDFFMLIINTQAIGGPCQ